MLVGFIFHLRGWYILMIRFIDFVQILVSVHQGENKPHVLTVWF